VESAKSEINLPEDFECKIDLPDDQCGALNGITVTSGTTGTVTCAVCDAILGIEESEGDDDFTISEEGEADDDSDFAEDEEGANSTSEKDTLTEWDADKRKEMAAREALIKLRDMLMTNGIDEATALGVLINEEFANILNTHASLVAREFYPARTYRKEMILTTILIHVVKEKNYIIKDIVIKSVAEDPMKIKPRVREGLRIVRSEEEGPVVIWMKTHGSALGIPQQIIDHAVDYFLDVEPKYVVGDDEIKALGWLVLVCRTSGFRITLTRVSKLTGRSRPSLGRVIKAYSKYFQEGNQ
jgi:hypothetical protein